MKKVSQTKGMYVHVISSMGYICGFGFAVSKIFSIPPSTPVLIIYSIIEILIILAIFSAEFIAARRREPILISSISETIIFGGALSLYHFLAIIYLDTSLTSGFFITASMFVIISTLLSFTKVWITVTVSLVLYLVSVFFAYPRIDKQVFYSSNIFLFVMLLALLASSININKLLNNHNLKDYDMRSKLRLCNMCYFIEVVTFFVGSLPGTFFINKIIAQQSEIQRPE